MRTKKEGIVLVTVLAVLFLSSIVLAVNCPIPDTGQTKCYDNDSKITCPNPGEDFYGQDAQYNINPQSYTSLAGGIMVQDNVTGLIWEVKQDKDDTPNYTNPHDADNTYTWYDGSSGYPGEGTDTLDFIAALNSSRFGGYSDWRLPTIMELSFLVDRDRCDPSINTTYFPNTVSYRYWSSTTNADYPIYAWLVYFGCGHVDCYYKSGYDVYVRAVRSGQCGSFDNFIDNGDGTVTNTDTGLMWQQDTAPSTYNWQEALSYCETLTLASHNDWRLPNVNELQSIVDYSTYSPSINTTFFPNTLLSSYWSSTAFTDYPDYAWYVDFVSGCVYGCGKSYNYDHVRAVRGGKVAPWISTTTSTSITTSSSTSSSTSSTTTTYKGNCSAEAPIDCFGDGSMCCWLNIPICCGDGYCYANQNDCSEPITTTIVPSTTTSIFLTSTTSLTPQPCVSESLYGEHSEETELLRYLRDNVLNSTPEGRELIKFYYELSPIIVEMMNEDEEFKAQVKEMVDGVLRVISSR